MAAVEATKPITPEVRSDMRMEVKEMTATFPNSWGVEGVCMYTCVSQSWVGLSAFFFLMYNK
jgi:hypothetical protein